MRVLIAMIVLASTSALADIDKNPDFKAAQELYSNVEYEQAILRLHRAARVEDLTSAEKARINLWLGLCFLQLLDQPAAETHLEEALRQDKDIVLPDFAPPQASEMFTRIKQKLEEQQQAPPVKKEPARPSPPPPQEAGGGSIMPVIGFAALGVGTVALAGGVVALVLAQPNADKAQDPDSFQDEARAAADAANVEIGLGVALLAGGALALAAGGGALLLE